MKHVDFIIIGSGMAGLYTAYKIKQSSPNKSFLILEKYNKEWIGGRTSNDHFYGTEILTGAGVGRKQKDKLLYKLLQEFHLEPRDGMFNPKKSQLIRDIDIMNTIHRLRQEYTNYKHVGFTFKQYATHILGSDLYQQFILSSGYTDYENEDAYETLYYYGIEDNTCCWKLFYVPWKKLVMKLYDFIGASHFRFSSKATRIQKVNDNPCRFLVETENGTQYMCNKVIVATTITGIRSLLPNYPIYNEIDGQPFLRLYAKFNKKSLPILKEYVQGFTILPGPLQKMIPMDETKGVYMIAYNDNKNALALKPYLENTEKNRKLYEMLLERALGIQENSLHIISIKDYYWPIGTHYYKPLNKELYKNREEFIEKAQNPETGIVVVGEVVSRNQGWTEGALESVKAVITQRWLNSLC